MERPIRSSNLALRFYRRDGWTEELLRSCLTKGDLNFFDDTFEWGDNSYWILTVGSTMDLDKLGEIAGPVFDFVGDRREGEEALAYVRAMSW